MWSPQVFWSSTYWEYSHALVGYMKFHGMGKWGKNGIAHWSKDDYQAAKDEITRAINTSLPVKEAAAPMEVRARLKAAKRNVNKSGR